MLQRLCPVLNRASQRHLPKALTWTFSRQIETGRGGGGGKRLRVSKTTTAHAHLHKDDPEKQLEDATLSPVDVKQGCCFSI